MKKIIHYENKRNCLCNNSYNRVNSNVKIRPDKMSNDIEKVNCKYCIKLYNMFTGGSK